MSLESNLEQQIEIQKELLRQVEREAGNILRKSWEAFKTSDTFGNYGEMAKMMSDFYESELRSEIPYPPYQLAAQHVGRDVVRYLAQQGFALEAIFPGNFESSAESETGSHDVRTFSNALYKQGSKVADVQFSFPHSHDSFDFPETPRIQIRLIEAA